MSPKRINLKRTAVFWSIFLLLSLVVGCGQSPAALDPQGPAAARIMRLGWIIFGVGTAVYLVVMAIMLYALFRRQRQPAVDNGRPDTRLIIWGGVILPAIILLVILGFTVSTLVALSSPETDETYVIEVIGHQWWWEVNYPNQNVITANEIHIPVGRPIEIRLKSQDVIHSFWVPELHGKLDMVPGQVNSFWLQADEPGEYMGICAEFCGIQHAKMLFRVIAEPEADFVAWLEREAESAANPTDPLAERGQALFTSANCAECHRIAGTTAQAQLGPDLTHFGSRRTLGAGIAPNNRGNLSGWIVDPQGMKPGNLMPATSLSGEELQALVAYLESLE